MQEYYYGNNFLSQGKFICKAPFNKSKCLIKDNTM